MVGDEDWGRPRPVGLLVDAAGNTSAVTIAATTIVVARIASGTRTIRVGGGRIMLPNHAAPYVIVDAIQGT